MLLCVLFACICIVFVCCYCVFFSSRRRHTRCALVTGVQTCALPIFHHQPQEPAAPCTAQQLARALLPYRQSVSLLKSVRHMSCPPMPSQNRPSILIAVAT